MKKQPTKRQLQIVESFIKNETKRIMKEEPFNKFSPIPGEDSIHLDKKPILGSSSVQLNDLKVKFDSNSESFNLNLNGKSLIIDSDTTKKLIKYLIRILGK